jgi:hypothetical protein
MGFGISGYGLIPDGGKILRANLSRNILACSWGFGAVLGGKLYTSL